jgi:alpha-beta hydrolase superfamily lysophospholipase
MFEQFQLKSVGTGLMGYHWPTENARVVLCVIHGMGEYGSKYDALAEVMVRSRIAVIAMDLRGHGCSVGKRGHIGKRETALKDVDSLLSFSMRKYVLAPVVLYGHSLGGNIALDYRLRGSLASMPSLYVAASPWLILKRKPSRLRAGAIRAVSRIKPDYQIRAHVNRLDDRLSHDYISAMTLRDGTLAARTLLDAGSYARKAQRQPLVIMQGTADRLCKPEGPRRLAELEGERCRLIEWEGYGHELHRTGAETDGRAVMEKLAELILGIL